VPAPRNWTIHDLWAKYEDIAMHFNDLLIRLRTQALAAVAALSTLVGVFTKTDVTSMHLSWQIATAVFLGLSVFWIAIWIVDITYYNRLLIGAVVALRHIEAESRHQRPSLAINISTTIEEAVAHTLPDTRSFRQRFYSRRGITFFYSLVLITLLSGAAFCFFELSTHSRVPTPYIFYDFRD
jgi:hypothetical protein